MDAAYRKSDDREPKELVFAWMFTDAPLEEVDPNDFFCPYSCCHVSQKLASYKQKEKRALKLKKNDKSGDKGPYFRVVSKKIEDQHHPDCPEFSKNKRKVKEVNGIDPRLPLEQISKLILREEHGLTPPRSSERAKTSNPDEKHHRQAYHLSNPVNWYLQNPTEGYRSIEVKGCSYSKYHDVFQRVSQSTGIRYVGKHIYFGSLELRGVQNFKIEGDEAFFFIYQFMEDGRVNPIKVRLKTGNFSQSKLAVVQRSYDAAQARRREILGNNRRSKTKRFPKVWIFFYGEPVFNGGREFIIERHDCIHFYTEEKLDLFTKNHFYAEPEPE
ncbi:hypothetical protein, partial [Vibrio lentus]|uniref:hypothetical protein n=1 Tax=Vibrio lentus TaxID=136468 RepID=UPI00105441B2